MSKQGLSIFGLRNRMIFFTLIGVMILGSQLLTAQSQQQGRLSPELQPVFKTYPIARVQASEAERVLSEVFANRSISVSHNAAQNTVQLWATQAEHAQIEHFLRQQQVLGTTQVSQGGSQNLAVMARQNAGHSVNGTPQRFVEANRNGRNIPAVWQVQNGEQRYPIRQVAGQTQAPPSLTANRASRHVVLKNLSVRQFEDKILTALQSRSVQPSRSIAGNQTYYSIPLPANQGTVEMMIESQSGVVTVTAPTALQVESFAQIIEMIDNEPQDVITAVVAVAQSNEQTLRDAIGMVNQAGGVRQFTGQSVGQDLQFRTPATGGDVRFGTQNGGTGTQQILPPDVGGLVGPVEVVILDGGMVVINARIASDMELVRQIIEYIEAMSREYDPIIVEVPMIHADCVRVAVVTQQLYSEWYVNQRGPISITPLVRPNSILLIGYQGSIQAVQELIAKLDQPIDAQAQFQVFRLRYTSAAQLKDTLDNLYTARTTTTGTTTGMTTLPGLASTMTIVSDQRTNSLIAQGAPRDLIELSALIMMLDKSDNEVEMVIEVMPLRNTIATNLAQILNQSLAGQTLTTTGTGGGGAGAQQQLTAPQSGVSFTTIDALRGEQVFSAGIFSGVAVVADTNGNNLVVKAPPGCMDVIRAVVRNLDSPPLAVAQMKIFTIINSDASTLLTMLNQVFGTTGTGGGAGATTVNSYQLGDSNENSAIVPVRFASETRTNSIVAVGSADMLAMVEAILLSLDEPDMHNRRMMVYRLLNTPADTIASTLQTFLQNERQLRQQANALVGDVDIFNSEIIITAETETNSLLVSTTPRHFDQLRRMIQVLDELPAMVKIQVLIGEVDISNTNELGFELGLQDSLLFDRSVLGNPGFNFNTGDALGNDVTVNPRNVGTQGLSNFSMGRSNSELGYGGFVFAASSESVNVLIRALEERNKITVLNRPMLDVLHNQEATISVGQSVPTITGSSVTDTGGQSNSINYQDVGVMLTVTPRIALDDSVAMQIYAMKSNMGSEQDGIPVFVQGGTTIRSPKINQAWIRTTVTARSGQVAVLGGLINSEDKATRRSVPVVSNIPIVGQLFQYNYNTCTRKELVFIFSPQVHRTEEEANALKQLELQRMHWCGRHVRNLIDSDGVRTRVDDFTSTDTVIERGGGLRIDETKRVLSDEIMIQQTTTQERMVPQLAPPERAPALSPRPSMLP